MVDVSLQISAYCVGCFICIFCNAGQFAFSIPKQWTGKISHCRLVSIKPVHSARSTLQKTWR